MISTAILSALHSAALYYRERTRSTGRRDPSADGTNVFVYLSMLPLAQTHTRSAVQPSAPSLVAEAHFACETSVMT